MKNLKKKYSGGFTIIESVVVLFIIGLLTVTASIGFSRANREKIVDQASRKVSAELGKLRDSSFLGQKVNDIFPCGYALSVKKDITNDNQSFGLTYTSDSGMDRLSVIDEDKICDEKINSLSINLASIPGTSPIDVNLGKARVVKIDGTSMGLSNDLSCLTVLFSAPRQGTYYCTGGATCPPSNCTFSSFSGDNKYFDITFSTTDGISPASTKILRISPSGNTSIVIP